MTSHQYNSLRKRVGAILKGRHIIENGDSDTVRANADNFWFGGYSDVIVKERTPVQFVLEDQELFLKVDKHFVWKQYYLWCGCSNIKCYWSSLLPNLGSSFS